MGMFDTITLEPPLICPACGHDSSALQTHAFGWTMVDTIRNTPDPLAAILDRNPPVQDPE